MPTTQKNVTYETPTARAWLRALFAVGVLAVVGPAMAADWYVSAANGDDANACSNQAAPCLTIQAAIDYAADGDTVHIAAGQYPENVRADKAITLLGPHAGVPGYDYSVRSDETQEALIVPPLAGDTGRGIVIEADDITIDGLSIRTGNSTDAGSKAAIRAETGDAFNSVTVRNIRVINSYGYGVYADPSGSRRAQGWVVEHSLFENLLGPDVGDSPVGIRLTHSPSPLIQNNIIKNVPYQGIQVTYADKGGITGNHICGIGVDGINMSNSSDVTISGNFIADTNQSQSSGRGGVRLYNNNSGVAIFENTLQETNGGVVFNQSGNATGSASVLNNAILGEPSFTNNWTDVSGVIIGANWYGGGNATRSGNHPDALDIDTPLAASPVPTGQCGVIVVPPNPGPSEVAAVPTLRQWAIALLGLLMAAAGFLGFESRKRLRA